MFLKITDDNEITKVFDYKKGLNIYQGPINKDNGGFWFTNKKNLPNFYSLGATLRIITVPKNNKIYKDNDKKTWRSDKIIIKDTFSLLNPKTYTLFDLDITKYDNLIDDASAYGYVSTLEWWNNTHQSKKFNYTKKSMDLASKFEHTSVLEWWKNSGLELKYSEYAINLASIHGKINSLEWWKNSGLELKYTTDAFDYAAKYGEINILKWWIDSKLPLKYSKHAMIWAQQEKQYHVIEWLNKNLFDITV